jgi:2-polyprenyl-3-methyl-5-hydroxy-6-metoxy-1,4-benzoquinol methylase
VYPYCRGFYVSELLRQGDKLLDIGCGDGFFTRRFFAKRCASIDAVDIEPDAIHSAHRENASTNIRYYLLDAVAKPFPGEQYDVIVWDGALGHFAQGATHVMLAKIKPALAKDGVFVGSESLGREGHEHLQFFETAEDLDRVFGRHFPFRAYRVVEYDTHFNPGFIRREVYWRCSSDPIRLEQAGWRSFSGMAV